MQTHNNESGRSLIEMLAVISIISMITIGSISGMNYGLQTFRANSAFELIENSARGAIDLFSWRRGFPTGENFGKWICENDAIPGGSTSDTCQDGYTATTTTGWGNMTMQPIDSYCFEITLAGVPSRGCSLLSNMAWRYATHGSCSAGKQDWDCDSASQTLTFFVE